MSFEQELAEWSHAEKWVRKSKNFTVEISRHQVAPPGDSYAYPDEGPYRWCVYAYIFAEHPHAAKFDGTERMWQEACTAMPFHGGPSFCQIQTYASGRSAAYKVGSDYNHLHDERFTISKKLEDNPEVFADAVRLYDWLASRDTAR